MNKIVQRLLVFVVGLPVALLLTLIGWQHHLPLQIVMLAFSLLGVVELYKMFARRSDLPPLPFMLLCDALIMASPYVLFLLKQPTHYVGYVFMLCAMLILTAEALRRGRAVSFEQAAAKVSLSILILFYCGYLFSFMPRIALDDKASIYLVLFLSIVFTCDSGAWFFGVLFGEGNRYVVASSPNKSIAGFVGGIAGSIIVAVGIRCFVPSVYTLAVWRYGAAALVVSAAAIVGDLVESVFKRSTGVKDSGKLMLGRGGILDSIDSILFSVPVYYLVMRCLI